MTVPPTDTVVCVGGASELPDEALPPPPQPCISPANEIVIAMTADGMYMDSLASPSEVRKT